MFCSKCGTRCEEGMRFCPKCGTAVVPAQPVRNMRQQDPGVQPENAPDSSRPRANGFSFAAMVLGIVSIFTSILAGPVSALAGMALGIVFLIPSMLAILFGFLGIIRRNTEPQYGGKNLAKIGLIIGIATFCLGWLLIWIGPMIIVRNPYPNRIPYAYSGVVEEAVTPR